MNDEKLLDEILSSLKADVKIESFNRSKKNKKRIK
jgi:hypothetical protein